MPRPPCTCAEHKDGAPIEVDGHVFERGAEEVERQGLFLERWRYVCSCGSRGLWTFQSDNVPYHSWLGHLARTRCAATTGTVGGTEEDPDRLSASDFVSRYADQIGLYAAVAIDPALPDAKVISIMTGEEQAVAALRGELGLAGTGLHESIERFQRQWLNEPTEGR